MITLTLEWYQLIASVVGFGFIGALITSKDIRKKLF